MNIVRRESQNGRVSEHRVHPLAIFAFERENGLTCSFMTSPHAGAPTRPVPTSLDPLSSAPASRRSGKGTKAGEMMGVCREGIPRRLEATIAHRPRPCGRDPGRTNVARVLIVVNDVLVVAAARHGARQGRAARRRCRRGERRRGLSKEGAGRERDAPAQYAARHRRADCSVEEKCRSETDLIAQTIALVRKRFWHSESLRESRAIGPPRPPPLQLHPSHISTPPSSPVHPPRRAGPVEDVGDASRARHDRG
jgi:hypothetical protein